MPVHLKVDSQSSAVRVRENTLSSVWRAVTLQGFAQNAKLRKSFIAEAARQSENGYISPSAKFNTSASLLVHKILLPTQLKGCGFSYDAAVLKEIERRFFAIEASQEPPDRYITMPEKSFA